MPNVDIPIESNSGYGYSKSSASILSLGALYSSSVPANSIAAEPLEVTRARQRAQRASDKEEHDAVGDDILAVDLSACKDQPIVAASADIIAKASEALSHRHVQPTRAWERWKWLQRYMYGVEKTYVCPAPGPQVFESKGQVKVTRKKRKFSEHASSISGDEQNLDIPKQLKSSEQCLVHV